MTQTTEAELVVSQEARDLHKALYGYDTNVPGNIELRRWQTIQRAMTQAADAAYRRGVEDAAKVAEGVKQRAGRDWQSPIAAETVRCAADEIADKIRNLTSGERDG